MGGFFNFLNQRDGSFGLLWFAMIYVSQKGVCVFGSGKGVFVKESANNTAYAAHIHNARNTEVKVAAFFRQNFSRGAVQNGNALHHGALQEGYNH